MKCKNCNKTIDEDSKFCQFCGEKIEKGDSPQLIDVDKELLEHLEFLGYEIEEMDPNGDAKRYLAKNKNKYNLTFYAIKNYGVSFMSLWNIDSKKVEKNKIEALEMVNRMNSRAMFCTFWITNDLSMYGSGALYLGKYIKKNFVDFLELFEIDTQRRFAEEDYLKKFEQA